MLYSKDPIYIYNGWGNSRKLSVDHELRYLYPPNYDVLLFKKFIMRE